MLLKYLIESDIFLYFSVAMTNGVSKAHLTK